MPRIADRDVRVELAVDSFVRLVTTGGLEAATLRGLAAEAELAPSSLLHHFESRANLLLIVVRQLSLARERLVAGWSIGEGVLAFLPRTEAEVVGARVWLCCQELARVDADVAEVVAGSRDRDRELVRVLHGRSPEESAVDVAVAVIEGLVDAVCAGADPMPIERARDALTLWAGQAILRTSDSGACLSTTESGTHGQPGT